MTILAAAALAAALAAAPQARAEIPSPPAPPAAASGAMGGPLEPLPLDPAPIVVEGQRTEPVSIVTDPRLERRYAPRERQPLNRIIMRF